MAKENPVERIRRSSVLIFAVVLIAYFVFGSIKLIIENYRVQERTARLEGDLSQLERRNRELQSLLAYYKTESYREKEARARLGFQKPGERVVIVPPPSDDQLETIVQPGIETRPATPPSNPQQWWEYFSRHGARRG